MKLSCAHCFAPVSYYDTGISSRVLINHSLVAEVHERNPP